MTNAYTGKVRSAVEKAVPTMPQPFTVSALSERLKYNLSSYGVAGGDRHFAINNELRRLVRQGKLKGSKSADPKKPGRPPVVYTTL